MHSNEENILFYLLGNIFFMNFYPSTTDDSSTTTTTEHHSLDGEIFDKFKNLSDSIHGNAEGREAAEDPVWDQHDVDVRTLGKTKVFFCCYCCFCSCCCCCRCCCCC